MTLFEPFASLFELSRERDRRVASGATVASFAPPADPVVTDDKVTVVMDVRRSAEDDRGHR